MNEVVRASKHVIQFHRSFFLGFFLSSLLNQVLSSVCPGIAIYFLSPRWPYTVNTAISLDSGPSTLVNLVDTSRPSTDGGPETVQSHVVWNVTGLANTQHNLLISVGAGQPFAIVDGLMYVLPLPSIHEFMPIEYCVSILIVILRRQMLAPPYRQLLLHRFPTSLRQLQPQPLPLPRKPKPNP